MGNSLMLFISSEYRVLENLSILLEADGKYCEKASPGSTGEPAENTGGKWFFISPGLGYNITNDLNLYAYVQVPVYQEVNGIQQSSGYNFQVGINADLGLLSL
jgi:hypothetical protein